MTPDQDDSHELEQLPIPSVSGGLELLETDLDDLVTVEGATALKSTEFSPHIPPSGHYTNFNKDLDPPKSEKVRFVLKLLSKFQ